MRVHFVVHEAFEAPGAYETWATSRGHSLSFTRLHAGDHLPTDSSGVDLLVVMGGPQDPATTSEECPHFDAAAEKALIKACVDSQKGVIGVCLGSQLIGEALGAPFDHSPEKEIGAFPIHLTDEGRRHPLFQDFGDTQVVGHWHNDMPGLTKDASVLAYSDGCPRQIVAYSDRVFGFQCHMEFTPEVVDLLIAASASELSLLAGHPFVQLPSELRKNSYTEMNQVLFGFLDRLSALLKPAMN